MPYEIINAPDDSWMSLEQAKTAYPDLFSTEGRPDGQLETLLEFLTEMDCVIAPIQDRQTDTPSSARPSDRVQDVKPI